MDLSLLDTILNVCRTPYDVLHILIYVIITFIAFLIAFHKFDKDLFNKYVYVPYVNFLLDCNFFFFEFPKLTFKYLIWTPISNRSPYIIKTLKYIWNKFFK